MIGFVGPADAVAVATTVAIASGIDDGFRTRTYTSPEESAALAHDLDRLCDVIIFAGRWPHREALADGLPFKARFQYVPESAVDLYQVIVGLLLQGLGTMPRISIDTVDRELAGEVFREVGLVAPTEVLPIDEVTGDWAETSAQLVEFHAGRVSRGEVDIAVTWLRSVHDELVARGVRVWRAQHTTSTYRDSLTRASLTVEAKRSKASQVAIGRVVPLAGRPRETGRASDAGSRQRLVDRIAKELRGTVTPSADGYGWLLYTTRGALERALVRHRAGLSSPFVVNGAIPAIIGFGVGTSIGEAIGSAERALVLALSSGQICVMHASGLMHSFDDLGAERVIPLRTMATNGSPGAIEGLGPLSTSRLIDSIALLDASALTASQLANAYGVTERSARRLLGRLEAVGVARRLGREGAPGPGRPRVLYGIDLERLADSEHLIESVMADSVADVG